MILALFCDIHLPYHRNAIQYSVFDWILSDIKKKNVDTAVCLGDYTADGNITVAEYFVEKMKGNGVLPVILNGNAEYRTPETVLLMGQFQTDNKSIFAKYNLLILHDGEATISEDEYAMLERANAQTVVCMHHPIERLTELHKARMTEWRANHPEVRVFFGHLHRESLEDDRNMFLLRAADPDKAIGGPPCLYYYDTETKELSRSDYECPMPEDLPKFVGISCYRPMEDIEYAIEHKLGCLELRHSIADKNLFEIRELIERWRAGGGWNLSMHAPNLTYRDGLVLADGTWNRYIDATQILKPDRITLHVPIVNIGIVRADKTVLEDITDFLAEKISHLPDGCIVGTENMHMRPDESDVNDRRFGYLPEELRVYTELLRKKCDRRIGINLDVGHARNNPPFSRKYTIGAWYAEFAGENVGYHIHQVKKLGAGGNHFPITEWYGRLISMASFFKNWEENRITHAPVIFEIRPGADEHHVYDPTIRLCGK